PRVPGRRPLANPPYEAGRSIERCLKRNYPYNQDTPKRRYPLSAFLFRDKIGYCQQFSGAMALMLRMSGIPTRVVSGFSPGTPDPKRNNHWVIDDIDAHSWVEIYFPVIAWVTVYPT